ncbi:MAG: selenium-dependent xanthine dehydrogenase [Candidatus Limnocylindrales bacterium]
MDFTLNGRSVTVEPAAGESLLGILRGACGLRSMKDGCAPEGSCGACTVIVDGRAVVSCARPASRVAGRTVLTLEGLPVPAREAWATAFVATGASQCGFCSPGIVMKAEALLRRDPSPSRESVARALAGNLCRCTGYHRILDAIELAAAGRRQAATRPASPGAHPAPAVATPLSSPAGRYEGRELALGEKPFVADLVAPGMLHAALRFADVPRALVRRIDVRRAAAMPGVVAVVTAADVPGRRAQGLIVADWPPFVAQGETIRYVGDVLAAVAAETQAIARAAAALVDVELEPLDPVTDPFAALADGAPSIHEGGNLVGRSVVRRGDADAALAAAAHVASATFRTQSIEHAFLEPEACLAVPRGATGPDGRPVTGPVVHVFSEGQGAWEDRRQLASLLALPEPDVLVTQVSTGGAFGGKEDLNVQGQAALLALRTGRPVMLQLTRRESLRFHVKRHPMWLDFSAGCDADGRLVAVRARITGDNGAYASVGAKVLERAAGHACGPYRVPNVDVEAQAVYTNNPPSGAMRGFGVNQAAFALEGVLDMLAEQLGIDGWEMRWRNALDVGDRFGTGQRLGPGVGIKATLLAVHDAYSSARWAGIACGAKNAGIGNGMVERGRVVLRPEPDGALTLFHSWTEMGQGCHTVFRQLAAAELGIPVERIRVLVDTTHELDTGETTASRATMLGGRAVLAACATLRGALGDGRVEDLAGREFPGEVVVDWTTPLDADEPVTHFAYGWATQVVILDEEGRIERVVAAHDVGRALNPVLLRGQVEGGVHMGLGMALTEEFRVVDGIPVTDTLKSLGIIPAAAMPPVETILVEVPQPEGPHGAKGMGEAVLVPTAAAVAGALHAYDGIRRTQLPMRDSAAARALLPRLAREPVREPAGEPAREAAGRGSGS